MADLPNDASSYPRPNYKLIVNGRIRAFDHPCGRKERPAQVAAFVVRRHWLIYLLRPKRLHTSKQQVSQVIFS
jgi:hypothetical protein